MTIRVIRGRLFYNTLAAQIFVTDEVIPMGEFHYLTRILLMTIRVIRGNFLK